MVGSVHFVRCLSHIYLTSISSSIACCVATMEHAIVVTVAPLAYKLLQFSRNSDVKARVTNRLWKCFAINRALDAVGAGSGNRKSICAARSRPGKEDVNRTYAGTPDGCSDQGVTSLDQCPAAGSSSNVENSSTTTTTTSSESIHYCSYPTLRESQMGWSTSPNRSTIRPSPNFQPLRIRSRLLSIDILWQTWSTFRSYDWLGFTVSAKHRQAYLSMLGSLG